MRLLHITPTVFDESKSRGGGERYATELAAASATKAETTLVTFGTAPQRTVSAGVEVRTCRSYANVRGNNANPVALGFLPLIPRADVVHCHQYRGVVTSLAILVARAFRKPLFVTDHGGGGWGLQQYLRLGKLCCGLLAVSEYSRALLRREFPRARVVFGGVDLRRFSPGAWPRGTHLVALGRMLPHKGFDLAIRALPAGASLTIIGPAADPRYYADLQQLARGKDVRFLISASDADVALALRSARALVASSVYRDLYGAEYVQPELFGLAAAEAMASATPVIATEVASLPEVVPQGETGLLVPPADIGALREAMQYLIAEAKVAERLGAAARRRAESLFRWDLVADRCFEAYEMATCGGLARDASQGCQD